VSIPIVAPFITFSCLQMLKILLEFSIKFHNKIALENKNFQKNPIFNSKNGNFVEKIITSLEKFEALKPMK
jgi:hypothetical protein